MKVSLMGVAGVSALFVTACGTSSSGEGRKSDSPVPEKPSPLLKLLDEVGEEHEARRLESTQEESQKRDLSGFDILDVELSESMRDDPQARVHKLGQQLLID
ncbi:hypothetical protein AAFN60_21455 [Roseibacillus persicicus]|uniref:hypothetical protein n=1 Tax=Roseibacillus persicicus TaxID=454148 RepID=UPI00398BA836